MSSEFGKLLKISVFGQSHGKAIGVNMDGLPAGEVIDLEALNAFGTDGLGLQLGLLAGGLAGFLLLTVLSCKRACARFESIDL